MSRTACGGAARASKKYLVRAGAAKNPPLIGPMTASIHAAPEAYKTVQIFAAPGLARQVTRPKKKRPVYSLPVTEQTTREAHIQRFRQWAESNPHDTPHLSDEAISRATIYGER